MQTRIASHPIIVTVFSGALCLCASAGALSAQTTPDQPAALLVYPHVEFDSARGVDTVVQLSNSHRTYPARVACFYQQADSACGVTSFVVNLTPGQPLQWRAGRGLSTFPLDGTSHIGPTGLSNQGSLIPPVPSDPFEGSLLCILVDRNDIRFPLPLPNNQLTGSATVERFDASPQQFDAAAYNAIGIPAFVNQTAAYGTVVLGGPTASYNACPQTLTVMHYFDGALDAATKASSVSTRLVIVPCTQDLTGRPRQDLVVQYEVINEFEQHLAVNHVQAGCEQAGALSTIDATAPERSIFSAAVQGTLTGQTHVYADQGTVGVLAVGIETHTELAARTQTHNAMFSVATVGPRLDPDVITLPDPDGGACPGDCNRDGQVTVDELVRCVDIAFNPSAVGSCLACDTNHSGDVSVDEIIAGVSYALNGCF